MQSETYNIIDDLKLYVQEYTNEVHNHAAQDRCRVMSNLYKERFIFNMIKTVVKKLEQDRHASYYWIRILCTGINQGLTPNLNMNGKQFKKENMVDLAE